MELTPIERIDLMLYKRELTRELDDVKWKLFFNSNEIMPRALQTVIFPKRYFTITSARKWLRKEGYIHNSKVDIKLNTLRFRQVDPDSSKKYVTENYGSVRLVYMY